jgi:hypothetical protein
MWNRKERKGRKDFYQIPFRALRSLRLIWNRKERKGRKDLYHIPLRALRSLRLIWNRKDRKGRKGFYRIPHRRGKGCAPEMSHIFQRKDARAPGRKGKFVKTLRLGALASLRWKMCRASHTCGSSPGARRRRRRPAICQPALDKGEGRREGREGVPGAKPTGGRAGRERELPFRAQAVSSPRSGYLNRPKWSSGQQASSSAHVCFRIGSK